jgi:ribonuclease R
MRKFGHRHNRPRSNPSARPPSGNGRPNTPPPSSGPAVFAEGALQVKGKFAFVLSEDPKVGDVLIQGHSMRLAMDGDRVRARVTSSADALRRSGEIVEVLKRAHQTAVGTFKRLGNMTALATDNDESVIRILDMGGFSPKVGDLAVVRITQWPTAKEMAGGTLIEILGSRDTPGVDLEAVIRRYELPKVFPADVEKEGDSLGLEVPESLWKDSKRELFFDHRVFTIDGADAKDFDDAVSLEAIPDGWRLGVHIADVAEYVKPDSPLDKEAVRRGTSVYFTGSVVPMLPFPLSDGLCSLRPNCVRLTLSCIMDINKEGKVGNYRVVESAIRSAKRFTYDDVEKILKGEDTPGLDPLIIADVREMGALARFLRKKRFERGSLDFDFPEPDVVTGIDGRPTDIRRRERLEAHKLIEDFMLLANETVARHMKGRPFLYRIHETPDPARLEKLQKSLEAVGLPMQKHIDASNPLAMRAVLAAAEGKPVQPMVHLMVLRSLRQAIYSPTNKGHYGLASECYTHFTSPIRRYPDLIVHRLLKERIHGVQRDAYWTPALTSICDHTSKRERIAVDAEREFMDIQKVRLMESHVGETFDGVVSGVTNFGFFVQLNDFFVEGLVHVTNLGNDYYIFDEARMTLTGRRTGRVFSIGTKVKIKLAAANILKRQLDFELLGGDSRGGGKHTAPPKKHFDHKHKQRHQKHRR